MTTERPERNPLRMVEKPEAPKAEPPVRSSNCLPSAGGRESRPPEGQEFSMESFLDNVKDFPVAEFEARALEAAMREACLTLRQYGLQCLEGDKEAEEFVSVAFQQILVAQVLFGKRLCRDSQKTEEVSHEE